MVAAGAVVGYAYTVHVRGLILLALHVVVLGVLVTTKRSRWSLALTSTVAALALTRLEWLTERLIGDRLEHGGVEPNNHILSRITSARGLVHTLSDSIGQVWHIGVATWGLAAVGIIIAVRRVRGRDVEEVDVPQRVILAITLAATAVIAFSSAAALPPDGRVTNHAYPRYIAFLAPVWVLLGIIALIKAGRGRAMRLVGAAAAMLSAGAFLVLARQTDLYSEWFHPFDAPEISFLSNTWNALAVARGTATALVLLTVFALALCAPRSQRLVVIGLAGVLLLDVVALEVVNVRSVHPMAVAEYATAPRLVQDLHIGPGDVVAAGKRLPVGPKLNHQREVYWTAIVEFDDEATTPPADATVVIASWNTHQHRDWDGEALGWRRVAGDPVKEWAVWWRASDPRFNGTISTGKGR